jgi:glycosyltransferase involved in cell wall biosynthesis
MNLTPRPVISVVIPAYNEAGSLPFVCKAVLAVLAGQNVTPELIVVDDGSRDKTRDVMLELCRNETQIRYLRLSRNFGKEAALSAGLTHATGAAVILMDADGQHPPAMLPLFLDQWKNGVQVVYAVQSRAHETATMRTLKHWYYCLMQWGSSAVIPADAGDFRLLDRKAVDAINRLPERNRFMKGLYAWVGFSTAEIPFQPAVRLTGRSHYNLVRLISLGVTGITSFSLFPLRLVSAAGVAISGLSMLYGLYLLLEHVFFGDPVRGFATLAIGMMMLSGIQLLALGVLAEYLGRIFEEVKQRPLYLIAEDTGQRAPAPPAEPAAAPAVTAEVETQ